MLKIALVFLKNFLISPRREWLKFETVFMALGITLAVCVLTSSLGLFEGYAQTLKNSILGANSHLYIFKDGKYDLSESDYQKLTKILNNNPAVVSFSPLISAQVMAMKNGQIKAGQLMGITWQQTNLPTRYRQYVTEGSWQLKGDNDCVIGKKIAIKLNIALGDSIDLFNPLNVSFGPMGLKTGQVKARVVGFYTSGMYEYDNGFIFTGIENARRFTAAPGRYNRIDVKLNDKFIDKADVVAEKMEASLGNEYQVHSWIFYNYTFFALLKLQKWALFTVLTFLVLIASANVVSSVLTMLLEKKREIGILKAYGANNKIIGGIIFMRAFFLNFVAIILGVTGGIFLGYLIGWQNFFRLKGDVYSIEKLSAEFTFFNISLVVIVCSLIVFITALLPLRKLRKMSVSEILRG